MGNTYKVKIISPNAKIIFRGKLLRTPVVCKNVYEKEMPFMKLQIHKSSLKYEITNSDDEDYKDTNINVSIAEKHVSEPKVFEAIKPEVIVKAEDVKIEKKSNEEIEIEEFYDPSVEQNSLIDRLIEAEKVGK